MGLFAKPLGPTALATLATPCNPKADAAVAQNVAITRNEVTFIVNFTFKSKIAWRSADQRSKGEK